MLLFQVTMTWAQVGQQERIDMQLYPGPENCTWYLERYPTKGDALVFFKCCAAEQIDRRMDRQQYCWLTFLLLSLSPPLLFTLINRRMEQ